MIINPFYFSLYGLIISIILLFIVLILNKHGLFDYIDKKRYEKNDNKKDL